MNREKAVKIAFFLLRVVPGLLFFQAGAMKMLGWFGGMPDANGAAPPMMSQIWIGGVMELVGGALILVGLFTPVVAFLLSGEMAVAYWQFHAPKGGWPIENGGTEAVLLCFIFLFIAAYGGGDWSLDALLKRRGAAKT